MGIPTTGLFSPLPGPNRYSSQKCGKFPITGSFFFPKVLTAGVFSWSNFLPVLRLDPGLPLLLARPPRPPPLPYTKSMSTVSSITYSTFHPFRRPTKADCSPNSNFLHLAGPCSFVLLKILSAPSRTCFPPVPYCCPSLGVAFRAVLLQLLPAPFPVPCSLIVLSFDLYREKEREAPHRCHVPGL